MGIVIESKLDKKTGPVATIVVKNGVLKLKDDVFSGDIKAKIRSLLSPSGQRVAQVSVGEAAEVLGFEKVPNVGSIVSNTLRPADFSYKEQSNKLILPFDEEKHYLRVVLCADSQGSLEAITNSFPKEVKFILQKTGEIDTSDILFAKSSEAIVLGFNVRLRPDVAKFAATEKVIVKNYSVIYEMIDEISDFIQGKIESLQEQIFGIAKILASFPYEKTKVMGVKVQEGRLAKGDKVRLIRGDEIIGETKLISVRQGKENVSKIEAGEEGGLIASPFLDFTIGDMLISHS
jgi:translation initiation factor IF-2